MTTAWIGKAGKIEVIIDLKVLSVSRAGRVTMAEDYEVLVNGQQMTQSSVIDRGVGQAATTAGILACIGKLGLNAETLPLVESARQAAYDEAIKPYADQIAAGLAWAEDNKAANAAYDKADTAQNAAMGM